MAAILTTATSYGAMFPAVADIAQSGRLDSLIALERIGTRHSFRRDQEVYADGDTADCWFKVVSGVVRLCKFLADGRRQSLRSISRAIVLVSKPRLSGYFRPRQSGMPS